MQVNSSKRTVSAGDSCKTKYWNTHAHEHNIRYFYWKMGPVLFKQMWDATVNQNPTFEWLTTTISNTLELTVPGFKIQQNSECVTTLFNDLITYCNKGYNYDPYTHNDISEYNRLHEYYKICHKLLDCVTELLQPVNVSSLKNKLKSKNNIKNKLPYIVAKNHVIPTNFGFFEGKLLYKLHIDHSEYPKIYTFIATWVNNGAVKKQYKLIESEKKKE